MRVLVPLLLLGGLTAPAAAGPHGSHLAGFHRARHHRHHHHRFDRHRRHHHLGAHFLRGAREPYWHHPYYLRRYGGYRPYVYHRIRRTYGYPPYDPYAYGYRSRDCGDRYGYGYGYRFFTYFPAFVSVAPVYSRLGVALTLDHPAFDGEPAGDADGLPRERSGPVGARFLVDLE